MSDLIVIGYPDETTAQKVWEELVKLEHDYLVDLEDAAVIRRDVKGKLHVTTPAHHAVAWGTLSGLFWGVLIGVLLLFPITTLVGVAGGLIGAAVGEAKYEFDLYLRKRGDANINWATGYRVTRVEVPAASAGQTLRGLDPRARYGVTHGIERVETAHAPVAATDDESTRVTQ